MENDSFKIALEVNVHFSESTRIFLSSLFASAYGCGSRPAGAIPEEPVAIEKTIDTIKEQGKSYKEIRAIQKGKEEAQLRKAVHEVLAPKKEEAEAPVLTIEMVRAALTEKINEHRPTIKAKLDELGTPNVTQLDPAKYQEMYNFLKSL